MRVRTGLVGVAVIVATLALPTLRVAGQEAPLKKLPRYRVDVVEFTSAAYYGSDLNDSGQVALSSQSPDVQFSFLARRWDPKGGFLTLAPERSFSTGINKGGDVTVVYEPDADHRSRSALWTQRDGLMDLGTIGRQTWAEDVSDHQVVVGWTERDTDARERYAFQWTQKEGLRTLPNLAGGLRESGNAFDVTNKGLIVGFSDGPDGQEAVRWVDGQVQGLGDFAGGLHQSAALAANDRGQIVGVGHVAGDGSDPIARAFLWSEGKGMVNLGALAAGHNSVAYDITDDGMVVGYSVPRPGGTSMAFLPFIWTEETGMVDVHTLLEPGSQAWRLGAFQMGRVNESGQILLHGMADNQFAMVMLTPVHNPEPGSVLMMAGVCAVLALRRSRRRDVMRNG